QDSLGDFHDDVVLDAELAGAVDRAGERDRSLLARELRRFRALRRRALSRDELKVRKTIASLHDSGFEGDLRDALAGAIGETADARPPFDGDAEERAEP